MNIIEKTYNWNGILSTRNKTDYIILHHMAGSGSADDIHKAHLNNGWTGIGYHFFVRKDGIIYRGRPIDKVGAHCSGVNSCSIGICFEGNFEKEKMSDTQIKSGNELINYLKGLYPKAIIKRHLDFNTTVCPGKNFPFKEVTSEIKQAELTSVNDIVWELWHRGIISDTKLWCSKLEDDVNSYWLARKTVKYLAERGI